MAHFMCHRILSGRTANGDHVLEIIALYGRSALVCSALFEIKSKPGPIHMSVNRKKGLADIRSLISTACSFYRLDHRFNVCVSDT